MTDDNSDTGSDTGLVDMDNLDSFSNTFFGKEAPKAPEPKPEVEDEEAPENEDDALATEPDKEASEDEKPTEDDEPDDEAEKPKPEKKSAQARINEVVAKQRTVERERDALAARVRELEAASTKKPEADTPVPGQTPLAAQLPADAPNPDALDKDGNPVYKLGEFDPQFIRDITRWTLDTERAKLKEEDAKETERKMVEAAQEELRSSWLQKVEETEKELPDLREKLGELESSFAGVNPDYGEFLAATIMSCEHGPEIMYYLSQNIGEAQKIVASGPAAATLALGRLDAKFVKAAVPQEEKRNKKQSAAPDPAPTATRGQGGRFSTPVDTNDLSAFERVFYDKK